MPQNPNKPLVAILNGNATLLEVMQEFLQHEGFRTVGVLVHEIQKGNLDFVAFLRDNNPHIIVYDIPPPYDLNVNFMHLMMDTKSMQNRCIVVTTTNKAQLEKLTDQVAAVEIVGKPFDLELIVRTINDKLKSFYSDVLSHTKRAA